MNEIIRQGYKDNTLFDIPCEEAAILIILSEMWIHGKIMLL